MEEQIKCFYSVSCDKVAVGTIYVGTLDMKIPTCEQCIKRVGAEKEIVYYGEGYHRRTR